MTPPALPICRDTADTGPCPFSGLCPEQRQRIAHYAPASLGGPIRGADCSWYQCYAERHPGLLQPPSESEIERAAIEAEGNA